MESLSSQAMPEKPARSEGSEIVPCWSRSGEALGALLKAVGPSATKIRPIYVVR
jgi:hypothetical protein